jgi:Chlorophyll A-B binding protein
MKISATVVFSSLVCVSGFSPSLNSVQETQLYMSEGVIEPEPELPPAPVLPKMSESMPFMERPAALDGSLVGDVGFDPLGFAKSKDDLLNYREAEIKHARLAMLAAAGWPISELFDKKLASVIGLAPVVGADDRAPSLLNGGLDKISPIYWVTVLLAAGAIDVIGIKNADKRAPGYLAGNYGFDPLGLYPGDEAGQKRMQLAELKNGRLAMIAITAFAVQEAVYKVGVVDETPLFFKPIGTVLSEYANAGYYMPN